VNAAEALRAGLLEHYRPILRYHDQEPLRADSPAILVSAVVGQRSTRLVDGHGALIAAAAQLPGTVSILDLDFLRSGSYGPPPLNEATADDHLVPPSGDWQRDAQEMHRRPDLANRIFGRAVQETPRGRTWLQYWFFYYFNNKGLRDLGDHEGDWEMIQIGLDEGGHPELATYAQHKFAEKRDDWSEVETVPGPPCGIPVVYVALGSHASYFKPGQYWLREHVLFDHAMAGPEVRPEVVRLTDDLTWSAWPGRWGSSGKNGKESPTGPARHERQWLRPDELHAKAHHKRKHLGPIYLAAHVVSAPKRVTPRRVGDAVYVRYTFDRLDPLDPDVPIRLLVSVVLKSGGALPVTASFDVTQASGEIRHPAKLGRGKYRVDVRAFSAKDIASPPVSKDVPDGTFPKTRTGGATTARELRATGEPPTPRQGGRLRLLVSADGGDVEPSLGEAVREVLGTDATGSPWQVEPLFGRDQAAATRLERHFVVAGRLPASGASPPSALAFGLARELATASGFEVHPDLPSSAYCPPALPEERAAARAEPPPIGWARKAIRCEQAWALDPSRGRGIVIGHPDTGFTDHPELEAGALDLERDWDLLFEDDDAHDPLIRDPWPSLESPGHGTGTGSVIVGRSAGQLVGVAPAATLVPIRTVKSVVQVFDGDVARAIDYARRIGVHVISMSLGGLGYAPALQDALDTAVDAGIIVLAAAGNYAPFVVAPARLDNCLAIAATNVHDRPWRWSSAGPEVDFSAPGEDVWVAAAHRRNSIPEYSIGAHRGSSFAVAHTAGAAALWLAHHGRRELLETYGAANLHTAFRITAAASARVPGNWNSSRYGSGILNVEALLQRQLPKAAEVAAAASKRGMAMALRMDRPRQILPELSPAKARTCLARLLGVPKSELDRELDPVAGELQYLLTEHRELREALVEAMQKARPAAAELAPVRAGLRTIASPQLAARMKSRSRRSR
jgi:subtilisin family serine protease